MRLILPARSWNRCWGLYADMPALYAESTALLMPTLFPTPALPPLEAWTFGVPVIISDLRAGLCGQAAEAAFLVDPSRKESIAAGLESVWLDPALRQSLIARGRERLARWHTPVKFSSGLKAILEEAKDRIRRGQTPALPIA